MNTQSDTPRARRRAAKITNRTHQGMTHEDWQIFERTPKSVLYAMVKHMAAARDGDSYDTSLESGSYRAVILEEWDALHCNGIVWQKPIKLVREP